VVFSSSVLEGSRWNLYNKFGQNVDSENLVDLDNQLNSDIAEIFSPIGLGRVRMNLKYGSRCCCRDRSY
jgi:hypothetical protein